MITAYNIDLYLIYQSSLVEGFILIYNSQSGYIDSGVQAAEQVLNLDTESFWFELRFDNAQAEREYLLLKGKTSFTLNGTSIKIEHTHPKPRQSHRSKSYSFEELSLNLGNNARFNFSIQEQADSTGSLNSNSQDIFFTLTKNQTEPVEERAEEEEAGEVTCKHDQDNPVCNTVQSLNKDDERASQQSKGLVESVNRLTNDKAEIKVSGGQGRKITITLPFDRRRGGSKTNRRQSKERTVLIQKINEAARKNGYQVFKHINKNMGGTKREKLILKQKEIIRSFKEKRVLESIEALFAFNKVACTLLTEPYLYLETEEEVRAELKRIQETLGKDIIPCFYQTLETAACGASHTGIVYRMNKEALQEFYGKVIEDELSLGKASITEAQKEEAKSLLVYGLVALGVGIGCVLLAPVVIAGGSTALAAIGVGAGATGVSGGTIATGIATTAVIDATITGNEIYNSNKNIRLNNDRVVKGIEGFGSYLWRLKKGYNVEDIKKALNSSGVTFVADGTEEKRRREIAKKTLSTAIGKTGKGGEEINGAINMIVGKFFASSPSFKHFEDLVYKMGASSALSALLKPKNLNTTKNDYDYPTTLYAEEVMGAEAQKYLYFLLHFPWYEIKGTLNPFKRSGTWWAFDTTEATDVFKMLTLQSETKNSGDISTTSYANLALVDRDLSELDKNSITYNESKNDFLKKNTLFNMQCIDINKSGEGSYSYTSTPEDNAVDDLVIGERIYNYFMENKETLKADQQKKIDYLLLLRDALVQEVIAANAEEFYENKDFKRYVESFNAGSIFKIMDTTAYPDIDLPEVENSAKRVNLLNPDFYYFKSFPKNQDRKDLKAIDKIVKNSQQWKKDIREHIVTNKPLKLGKADISDEYTINSKTGSGLTNTGNQNTMKMSDKPRGSELETFTVPELPINFGSFNDPKEIRTYVKAKQREIKNKNKELEGIEGMMGGKNYDEIMTEKQVEELISKAKGKNKSTIEQLGSVFSLRNKGIDYNNVEELKKLALESNEMEMLNLGMLKAFPTFRFYIIEEDSIYSDKLTAYDDFYSYASVISFSTNNSRELPASTAQIILQNVSGVLDGSKKEVYRDIDADSRKIMSDNDDRFESEIESIVLRPGVNAQLRAGYNVSCSELEILISGRITEVQYSNDGMTTTVTLQSFGVELDQKIENNLARNNKENRFYSTHQLLGGLMLSTQLKHFGRIKTGKIFQDGENSSAVLDSRMPNERGGFSFYYTNQFTMFLGDNVKSIIIGLVVMGLTRKTLGPLARRFNFTQTIKVFTQRTASKLWTGGGKLLGSTAITNWARYPIVKLIQMHDKVFRFISPGIVKATSKLTNRSFMNRVTYRETMEQIVVGIKNKTITNLNQLTPKQKAVLDSIRQSLSPEAQAALSARAGGELLEAEAIILFRAIREQGLAFQLSGFSARGLANASAVAANLTDAAIKTGGRAMWGNGALGNMRNWVIAGSMGYGRGIVHTAALTVAVTGGVGLLGLYADGIYNAASYAIDIKDDIWEKLFGKKEDDTLRVLLSPQDDNLFLPDSKSYLRVKDKKEDILWKPLGDTVANARMPLLNAARFGTGMMNTASFGLTSLIPFMNVEGGLEERFKEFKTLFDTRLSIDKNENIYFLKSQTIFDVFHEMSLRHPGYIYGARPYGDSIEYRMFFGLPNQRYWAEELKTIDAIRLNKILRDYGDPKNKGVLPLATCIAFFPTQYNRLKEALYNKRVKIEDNLSPERTTQKAIAAAGSIDNIIRIEITNSALEEYLTKTKKRFVPFRKMHLLTSNRNIIANNVVVSGHDVINTVSVHYSTLDENGFQLQKTDDGYRSTYAINLSSNTAIPQEMQKPKTFHSENIVGPAAAYRYGIGQLLYGARNMYQGSILTLGNPKINPWDVIILNDDVNRMYGPLEVKSVNHSFSHEHGFLTDIEVSALVTFGEDSLTYPSIVSSILGQAKEQIFNDFSSRAQFDLETKDSDNYYKELIGDIVDEGFKGNVASDKLRSALKAALLRELKKEMKLSKEQNRPFFLRDVLDNDISLPQELNDELTQIFKTGLEGSGYYAGVRTGFFGWNLFRRGSLSVSNVTGKVKFPLGSGFTLLVGGLWAGYAFSDRIINNVESSLNSGRLGKNLFRPVLMSKVSNQSLIEVYPIVKDGKPLLAGGFEGVPASQSYQNVLGNIYSDVSDGIKGFIKNRHKIEKRGAGSIYEYDDDFIRREQSTYEVAMGQNTTITTQIIRRFYDDN